MSAQYICAISRPNFIFILTDDQDYLFNSISVMPSALSFIGNNGLTFKNAMVATPVCCPRRTQPIGARFFHYVTHSISQASCT